MKFTNPSLSFYIFAGCVFNFLLVMICGMKPTGNHTDAFGSSSKSTRFREHAVTTEIGVMALLPGPLARSTRDSSTTGNKDLEIIAQLVQFPRHGIFPKEFTQRCRTLMDPGTAGLHIPKRMDEKLMKNIMLSNNVYVFAMRGSTIYGMIAAAVYGLTETAFIQYFYVTESLQCSNLAEDMKKQLTDRIARTEITQLRVVADDGRSQRFFQKLGFHYIPDSRNEYRIKRAPKHLKIEVAAFDLSSFFRPLTEHDLLTGQKRDWEIIKQMMKSSPYKYVITEREFFARCAPLMPFRAPPAGEINFWQMSDALMRLLKSPSSVFVFAMEGPIVRGMIGAFVISAAESISIKHFYVHESYEHTGVEANMFKALTVAVKDTEIKQISIRNGVNDERATNLFKAQFGFKRGDELFTKKDYVLRLK